MATEIQAQIKMLMNNINYGYGILSVLLPINKFCSLPQSHS